MLYALYSRTKFSTLYRITVGMAAQVTKLLFTVVTYGRSKFTTRCRITVAMAAQVTKLQP
jgi:hypothetical protein